MSFEDSLHTNKHKSPIDYNPYKIEDTIWGYRFQLEGDFLGIGSTQTLKEIIFNRYTLEEIPKYTPIQDYMYFQGDTNRITYLISDDSVIDSLLLFGDFGLHFAETLHDVNDNGRDEIGIVFDYADASSVNTYRIYEYQKNTWVMLYSFEIREWEFPSLPELSYQYGYLGTAGIVNNFDVRDSVLEKLTAYSRVEKVGFKTIQFKGYSAFEGTFYYIKKEKESPSIWLGSKAFKNDNIAEFQLLYGEDFTKDLTDDEISSIKRNGLYFDDYGMNFLMRLKFK